MQIVINIDSYVLEHCKRHVREHYANNIEEAIAKGTPLPKGYGRLIDGSALLNEIYNSEVYNDDYYYGIVYHLFEEAPTIIEADKEGRE